MIREIVEVGGNRWRVEAKSMAAAQSEIALAICIGSIGSRSEVDSTLCGGSVELLADVHRLGADGNDVRPQ